MPHDGTSAALSSLDAEATEPLSPAATPAVGGPGLRHHLGVPATFRALRHRNYRLYFFGQLISVTGSWMQTTALMWLVYEITHQSTWSGLIGAAQILPTFFLGTWGGVLADYWPKRSLIFITQTIFMLLALLLAGLVYTGIVVPWQLLLVSLAAGVVQALDLPARLSFVSDMAGRDDLMNAVALNSLLFNLARVLGPVLAGVLYHHFGAGPCFLANGLSFLAVLWALAEMDVSGVVCHPPVSRQRSSDSLLAGFRYLAERPGLVYLVLMAGAAGLCGWPLLALLPALAKDVLQVGEQGYSWMISSMGIGALLAAFVVATFGSLARRRLFLGAGIGIVTVTLMSLALAGSLFLADVCCALIGFGLILFAVTGQSVVQLSAGDTNRGRVLAVWAMIQCGTQPLGNVLSGVAADGWGVPLILAADGAAFGLIALVLLGWLRLRTHPRPHPAVVQALPVPGCRS